MKSPDRHSGAKQQIPEDAAAVKHQEMDTDWPAVLEPEPEPEPAASAVKESGVCSDEGCVMKQSSEVCAQ